MSGGSAAGLRSVTCAVAAAALVAGCGLGERARPDVPTRSPGAATDLPEVPAAGGSPTPTATRLPDDLPTPRQVDQKDATALSKAALTVMYTVDSTVDTGLRDAKLRAARYLTPEYTAKVRAEPGQYAPADWQRHRAYLAVRLKPLKPEAGAPADAPTTAHRQWEMTTTPTGRDDWRGASSVFVVFMALSRPSRDAPWRVSDMVVTGR
ncbi:hypothetical protein [Actinomadura sp. 21ATH]|uniref:hypothetical protein n=1 Tax=Actinomadura sp. 21ATH TaxID=1735444 RepID=UPI0035C15E5C